MLPSFLRPQTPDTSLYHTEQNEYRLAFSRGTALVAALLIVLGLGLDFTLYREQFGVLAPVRLATALAICGVYLVLRSRRAADWVRPLTLLWLSMPQLMISWMIWRTEGDQSIYFVGLHLALYATGIILPISFFESLAFGLGTLGIYIVACALHPGGIDAPWQFTGYSLFLLTAALLSSFCTYFNERGRYNLFLLRREVAERNATLHDTNTALADVKGQLIQREKMAALGTLSAGLLHEVNNPVNYSLMALNMAMTDPAAQTSADLKESLTDAREGMQRVQNIVSDLKTFAYQKVGEENSERVFLAEKAVRSAERLTGFELRGIDFTVDLPMDTHVRGDEPAIIGVLINLLGNAALAVRNAQREAPAIAVRGWAQDGRLFIAVRDNGTGIKPENLTRVFEPFFTTRDVGQGLGLGLSMAYSIIQRHGGELKVASELGAWTEFTFDLVQATQQA